VSTGPISFSLTSTLLFGLGHSRIEPVDGYFAVSERRRPTPAARARGPPSSARPPSMPVAGAPAPRRDRPQMIEGEPRPPLLCSVTGGGHVPPSHLDQVTRAFRDRQQRGVGDEAPRPGGAVP